MNKLLIESALKLEDAAKEYRLLYQKGRGLFDGFAEREAVIWVQNNATGEGVFIADSLNAELIKMRLGGSNE